MHKTDRPEVLYLDGALFLGKEDDQRIIQTPHAMRVECVELLDGELDVSLDDGPSGLIEAAREPIWARCLVRRQLLDGRP